MILKINSLKAAIISFFFLTVTVLLLPVNNAVAQAATDTSKKILLAALDNKAGTRFLVKKSNAVFPEILKGNEEPMLPYIEKFSSKRKDYLVRMFMKGKSYLLKAATVLKKYDLPIVDRKKAGADARNEYSD